MDTALFEERVKEIPRLRSCLSGGRVELGGQALVDIADDVHHVVRLQVAVDGQSVPVLQGDVAGVSPRPDRYGQQLAALGVGPQGNQVVQRRQAGFVFKHDAVVLGVGISVADGGAAGRWRRPGS